MASKTTLLVAEAREVSGSAAAGRLRRAGRLPGAVSTEGKEILLIALDAHGFEQLLHGYRSENVILDLQIGEAAPRRVLLKELQHHPVTGTAVHADFMEISMTRKMRISIPVRLVGDPVGVTIGGGVLEHVLRSLEVECLPSDLMDEFPVDVSGLEIGHSILARDVKLGEQFTLITPGDVAVAAVLVIREEEVAPAAEVEGAATTEPEVIGEKERQEKTAADTSEKGGKGDKAAKSDKKEEKEGGKKEKGK